MKVTIGLSRNGRDLFLLGYEIKLKLITSYLVSNVLGCHSSENLPFDYCYSSPWQFFKDNSIVA